MRVRDVSSAVAELAAVEIIRSDASINSLVQNAPDDPPMIYLDSVGSLVWFNHLRTPAGATWYDEDDTEAEIEARKLEIRV